MTIQRGILSPSTAQGAPWRGVSPALETLSTETMIRTSGGKGLSNPPVPRIQSGFALIWIEDDPTGVSVGPRL